MIHKTLIKNLNMKKRLTILTIAFISVHSLFAQKSTFNNKTNKHRFGLFAGPTFNSMKPTSSVVENYGVRKSGGNVGFSFGINIDFNLNERYTVFTGVGMDWRGGTIKSNLPLGTTVPSKYLRGADVNYITQYVTIPLGLKMTVASFDQFKIQLLSSFDLGILLAQKGDVTFYKKNAITGNDTTEVFNKITLGGSANVVPLTLGSSLGIGFEYEVNDKNAFSAQLIYRNGFVDITNPKTNDEGKRFSDGNIRSNTFAIRIGYTF